MSTRSVVHACRAAGVVVAVLAAAMGWLLLTAAPAAAHVELLRTEPASGAQLEEAPARITLVFSGAARPVPQGFRVLDARGDPVGAGSPRQASDSPDIVRLSLPADLGDGAYTVVWRVVSADGHVLHGAFVFAVGQAGVPPAAGGVNPAAGAGDPEVGVVVAGWVLRWAGYVGVALFVGGAVFVLALWPAGRTERRARRLLRAGSIAVAAGAAGQFVLRGPVVVGGSLGSIAEPGLLAASATGYYGRTLMARLVLLAGAAAVLAYLVRRRRGPAPLPLTGGLVLGWGLLATWAATGHTAAGERAALAMAADTVHLAAMCVWVGGLVLLSSCLLAPRRLGELTGVLPRFSRVAMSCVAVLVVTGGYQAWRELGGLAAFTGSGYGRLLLAKLATFTVLLALGALARAVVQRRYVAPVVRAHSATATAADATAAEPGPLRRSVAVEAAVTAAILAITSSLVVTSPQGEASASGGAGAAAAGPYANTLALSDKARLRVRLTPARRGPNELTLTVRGPGGAARAVPEVRAQLRLPSRGLGPLPVRLTKHGPGRYHASRVLIPIVGTWVLDVTVRTSKLNSATVTVRVPVQ